MLLNRQFLFSISKILLIWLFISAVNFTKPFHIDDTFHVETAQWIENNPLKPMTGKVNWGSNPNYIYTFNQPVLLFYVLAVYGHFFSYSEISLHVLIAVFTFFALWFFVKLTEKISKNPKTQLLALIIFACSPFLMINQNVMIDVPLLSFQLAFLYYLIKNPDDFKNYWIAAFFLTLLLLTKYSSIPLIGVYVIAIYLKHRMLFFKYLIPLFVPFIAFVLWSMFNYWEYGSIHFFDRPTNEFSLKRIAGMCFIFIVTLGAFSPIGLLFFKNRKLQIGIVLFLISQMIFVYLGLISETFSDDVLFALFFINGAWILVFLVFFIKKNQLFSNINFQILGISVFLMSIFLVVFAPFMASRHLLLVFQFIVLISLPFLETISLKYNIWVLILLIGFGFILSISDWQYANFYKKMAGQIANELPHKKYSSGHWGWQYYSKMQGMIEYGKDSTLLNPGDLIVEPKNISKQDINSNLKLKTVSFYTQKPNVWTFFSGHNRASFYHSSYQRPPWRFSRSNIDTVFVYKVLP